LTPWESNRSTLSFIDKKNLDHSVYTGEVTCMGGKASDKKYIGTRFPLSTGLAGIILAGKSSTINVPYVIGDPRYNSDVDIPGFKPVFSVIGSSIIDKSGDVIGCVLLGDKEDQNDSIFSDSDLRSLVYFNNIFSQLIARKV
jgi:hypothetical protein